MIYRTGVQFLPFCPYAPKYPKTGITPLLWRQIDFMAIAPWITFSFDYSLVCVKRRNESFGILSMCSYLLFGELRRCLRNVNKEIDL